MGVAGTNITVNLTEISRPDRMDGRDGTMTDKKVSCMEKEVSRMERSKAQYTNPNCPGHPGPVAGEASMKILLY